MDNNKVGWEADSFCTVPYPASSPLPEAPYRPLKSENSLKTMCPRAQDLSLEQVSTRINVYPDWVMFSVNPDWTLGYNQCNSTSLPLEGVQETALWKLRLYC